MAVRIVFAATHDKVVEIPVQFEFHPGFALSQAQKNIHEIHQIYEDTHPNFKVLEVSSKGYQANSAKYSAFNLRLDGVSLEILFQGSKVFMDDKRSYNGPYLEDIRMLTPKEAKNYVKSRSEGEKLAHFEFKGKAWPLEPKTIFYDWLYFKAFLQNGNLSDIEEFDAFTDICFNQNKQINCQARSIAMIKVLAKKNLLKEMSRQDFVEIHKMII